MFQIIVRGKIFDVTTQINPSTKRKTVTVCLEVGVWRHGSSQSQYVQCVLNEYWSERFLRLDDKTKYIMFRGSDMSATHEATADGGHAVYMWLKAEEFFL